MRVNGGDGTERCGRKVADDLMSVTSILAIMAAGRMCEQQQKQQSSSDGSSEGSFVGRLLGASR